jgi:Mn-dependent DtxR family transcriptional regulator
MNLRVYNISTYSVSAVELYPKSHAIKQPLPIFIYFGHFNSGMTEYNLPRASGQTIRNVIVGYYRSSDGDGPLSRDDAAEETDVSADVIRRQHTFLEDIGVLRRDGDRFLTEDGREIGRALVHNRESEAKVLLKDLLTDWDLTTAIIEELESEQKSEEELLDDIAYFSETEPDSARKRSGMNGLIDLYDWVGILFSEDGELYELTDEAQSEQGTMDEGVSPEGEESGHDTETIKTEQNSDQMVTESLENHIGSSPGMSSKTNQVTVQLDVSPDDDPDNVKEIIKAIRSGFLTEIESEEQQPVNPD